MLVWADTWRVAKPSGPEITPAMHPFTLQTDDLSAWLSEKNLLPSNSINATASLTLPSKTIESKETPKKLWSGLPLQAGEAIPNECEWWPWQVEGLAIEANIIPEWISKFPLSGDNSEFGEELRWWSHLQRWALSLIARGRWLPQVELSKGEGYPHRARWVPLLNREEDRQKLEELAIGLPLVATCALPWREPIDKGNHRITRLRSEAIREANPIASCRPRNSRLRVANLLQDFVDAQLRKTFEPNTQGLDKFLAAWQQALSSDTGIINLPEDEIIRLSSASQHWKEGITGNIAPARVCLELSVPEKEESNWKLDFYLQAEADPTLKVPATEAWATSSEVIQLGDIRVNQPSEIILEGLGRALTIFEAIGKGLNKAKPTSLELTPTEAFIFIQTASSKLRDIGIGVELPQSLSGGLASRLGLTITADLPKESQGISLGENLIWTWELMIGGVLLTFLELEKLLKKNSPLVEHKGIWIELRPNDLKHAEKFVQATHQLSLDDAINLTATNGNTFQKLPVHRFQAGPRLQNVLEQYHQYKAPEPLAAPKGFRGQLRLYQERGLGWLNFLNRFDHGACLADDMGLGKTIQLLAFLQHLKVHEKLVGPVLLIAPTSVLTNWKREALNFTPDIKVYEHYGSQRFSNTKTLTNALKKINLVLTSYGLMQRDSELLASINWQGIVIDEAQAIKNPKSKQSYIARNLANQNEGNCFKIALTGTPVENRINEIWALMNFLNPKILGDENFFRQRYRLPIEQYGDVSSLKDLKARVSPFILRRLKTDKTIISDLPQKIEIIEWVDLSAEQKHLYRKTIDKNLHEVSITPKGKRHGKILGMLTSLKQICNHPALLLKEKNIEESFSNRSVKLQRLEEILEEILDAGDRALLFTQFAEWGHLLQSYMQKKWGCEVPFLYGGTQKNDRQLMVDRFQEDPRGPQLFLLSLKAGGTGLNLTRASHVFHLDRWWNPAVENQATDRAYRIGQSKNVFVHKFITTGSIEEKIDQIIKNKTKLSQDIIGSGEDWLGSLDINELQKLVTLEEH